MCGVPFVIVQRHSDSRRRGVLWRTSTSGDTGHAPKPIRRGFIRPYYDLSARLQERDRPSGNSIHRLRQRMDITRARFWGQKDPHPIAGGARAKGVRARRLRIERPAERGTSIPELTGHWNVDVIAGGWPRFPRTMDRCESDSSMHRH